MLSASLNKTFLSLSNFEKKNLLSLFNVRNLCRKKIRQTDTTVSIRVMRDMTQRGSEEVGETNKQTNKQTKKKEGTKERKRKGGNGLFNDALNTFYLRLYGVGERTKERKKERKEKKKRKWQRGRHEVIDTTKERKGNALFNDALSTFYLRLYGVGHMVKDHSDSERGNPLPPHRLLFSISSTGFVTPVVEHWLEREIAQWVHPMKDRSNDPSHHERTLLPRSYISLHTTKTLSGNTKVSQ